MSLIASVCNRLGLSTASPAPAPWSHFPSDSKVFISSVEHSGIENKHDVATLFRSCLTTRFLPFVTQNEDAVPTIGMVIHYLTIGNAAMCDAAEFNGGDKTVSLRRRLYREYNDGVIFLVDATDNLNRYVERFFNRVLREEGMDGKPALFLYCYRKKPDVGEKKQGVREGQDGDAEAPWTMEEVERMVGKGKEGEGGRSLGFGRKWTLMNAYLDSGEGIDEGLAWLGHAMAEFEIEEQESRGRS